MVASCAGGLGPVRTCFGCRLRKGRSEMQRLVLMSSPMAFKVVVDHQKRMPGRGVWFCGEACLTQMLKRRSLGRAFKVATELDISELG